MMRPGCWNALVVWLAVLGGTIPALGPGLHALTACDHHETPSNGSPADERGHPAASPAHERLSDPCVTCRYLARASEILPPERADAGLTSAVRVFPAPTAHTPPFRVHEAGSRAPPAA